MSPTLSPTYLTREDAAERLKVSIRTIDRYIRRDYFQTEKTDQHVWISRPSFERYYREHRTHAGIKDQRHSSESVIQDSVENLSHELKRTDALPHPEGTFAIAPELQTQPPRLDYDLHPAHIYRSLFEDLRGKHEEQQKRLEGAHYRVGQLEAELKGMIPLVEFKREEQRFLLTEKQQKAALEEAQGRFARLKRIYKSERLNKNVYISLVYALLALHVVFWGVLR